MRPARWLAVLVVLMIAWAGTVVALSIEDDQGGPPDTESLVAAVGSSEEP